MQVLKESIRNSILYESRKEFASIGYAAASMKVIAARCGISVGTLYKYFGNKRNLFDCIVAPAKTAMAQLCDCRDAEAFYSIARSQRVELRIMLFKGITCGPVNCSTTHGSSTICRKMRAEWMYALLHELLMHKPTKTEATRMINEYICAMLAASNNDNNQSI